MLTAADTDGLHHKSTTHSTQGVRHDRPGGSGRERKGTSRRPPFLRASDNEQRAHVWQGIDIFTVIAANENNTEGSTSSSSLCTSKTGRARRDLSIRHRSLSTTECNDAINPDATSYPFEPGLMFNLLRLHAVGTRAPSQTSITFPNLLLLPTRLCFAIVLPFQRPSYPPAYLSDVVGSGAIHGGLTQALFKSNRVSGSPGAPPALRPP